MLESGLRKPFRPIPPFNIERFLSRIKAVEDGCWEWTGGFRDNGYAIMWIQDMDYQANRISYDLFVGIKDLTKVIDHMCMNKKCVNPDHLREVTEKVNALENSNSWCAKSYAKTHCKWGHEFTPENTQHLNKKNRKPGSSARACITCRKIRSKKWSHLK